MSVTELNVQHLAELANIIVDIDTYRTTRPDLIHNLVDVADQVIERMKLDLFDIGRLPEVFGHLAAMKPSGTDDYLAYINAAHDEVKKLLGNQLDQVYYVEEAA